MAGTSRSLLTQCQRGCHELSVRKRTFVHSGWNHGSPGPARNRAAIMRGGTRRMTTIAYISNSFPEASEAYVSAEILGLRRRGCRVVPCSFRKPRTLSDVSESFGHGTRYVSPLAFRTCLLATWTCISRFAAIADLVRRAMQGPETFP